MNPSTSGWINKFKTLDKSSLLKLTNFKAVYTYFRANGFLYGYSQSLAISFEVSHKLSQDEIEKVNLLSALYALFSIKKKTLSFEEFITSVLNFYKTIEVFELSLWDKFIAGKDHSQQLERILHEHVQIDQNMFTKHFNKQTTNALLFIDVLAYHAFLNHKKDLLNYTKSIEHAIVDMTNDVNQFTKNSTTSPLKQVTESLSISENSKANIDYRIHLEKNFNAIEKCYVLDIAALSVWDTNSNPELNFHFIKNLGIALDLKTIEITSALDSMTFFYQQTKDSGLFTKSNAINNFYDNTSQLVIKLIKRNSKRLVKEISQSKELMILLSQSTLRDLNDEEQDKVQQQLLDILKTIPSLAIFLLPGGAILLPIFAKLIPNLLPSSFNDNKVEKEEE